MKAAGIITEYNPFHNGHKYHIREARRITGADYIIAVMSGNFVQRGAPAMMDKYSRAMMALQNGADIVIELPACYATGSAEYFALGAVSLLDRLGVVDYLCFGSESGDIGLITEAASLLHIASEYIDEQLPHLMRMGLTYPAARARALEGYLSSEKITDRLNTYGDTDKIRKLLSNIISEPNNILGVEYVRALRQISSSVTPVTIKRVFSHYHDRKLTDSNGGSLVSAEKPGRDNEAYSSATSIRNIIEGAKDISGIAPVINSVPEDVYAWFTENYSRTYPVTLEDFSAIIRYRLLHEDKESLSSCLDISSDLAERILNLKDLNISMSDLIKKLKTRNFTQTRINRALIHLLLDIREDDVREYRKQGYVYYARILGIKKSSTPLIRKISKINQIPVITKLSKATGKLAPMGNRMLNGDILAAHIYNQIVYEKFGTSIPNEYRHGISMV